MAIILKYCFWGDDEKRDAFIPLTNVKFIDTRKEMRGIAEDTVVSFNYRLVNIGQHDLRIGYINPDCVGWFTDLSGWNTDRRHRCS